MRVATIDLDRSVDKKDRIDDDAIGGWMDGKGVGEKGRVQLTLDFRAPLDSTV